MKTWLDVSVLRCPNCGRHYVEASWYVVEMEVDIQCGECGKEFNSKKNAFDRVLLEFEIGEDGKLQKVNITKRLSTKRDEKNMLGCKFLLEHIPCKIHLCYARMLLN